MKNIFNIIVLVLLSQSVTAQNIDFLNSGDAYMQLNNYKGAIEAYENHVMKNPNDIVGYIKLARVYELTGQLTQQRVNLNRAYGMNPFADLYINPSFRTKYLAKKRFSYQNEEVNSSFVKSPLTAINYKEHFNEMVEYHSQDSTLEQAIYYLSQNNISAAEAALESIIPNINSVGIIHDLKGLIALKRGETENALKYFNLAIAEMPEFALAYHNRAICYELLDEHDKAVKDLNKAISLNNKVSIFYFTLAKLNETNENYNEAFMAYDSAIVVNENYYEALTNYSQLLKGLGEYNTAKVILDQAFALEPDRYENYFLLANFNFTFGEYDLAIDNYSSYLDEFPEDLDALFNRGISKILLRQKLGGCQDIKSSLENGLSDDRLKIYQNFCEKYYY